MNVGSIVSWVTLATALTGGAAAVEQLLWPARLRRTESWAREATESEQDGSRRRILKGIEEGATARLVASEYVPAHVFTEVAVWTIVGAVAAFLGTRYPIGSGLVFVATAFLALWLTASHPVHYLVEWHRIAEQYVSKTTVIPEAETNSLKLDGHWIWSERLLAALYALGVTLAVSGLGWWLHGHWWSIIVVLVDVVVVWPCFWRRVRPLLTVSRSV